MISIASKWIIQTANALGLLAITVGIFSKNYSIAALGGVVILTTSVATFMYVRRTLQIKARHGRAGMPKAG